MRERHGSVQENLTAANAERVYNVTRADLPLHCPQPSMYLWNSHPKVYLPIEATGEAKFRVGVNRVAHPVDFKWFKKWQVHWDGNVIAPALTSQKRG